MRKIIFIYIVIWFANAGPDDSGLDRILYVHDYKINIAVNSHDIYTVSNDSNWKELKDIDLSEIDAESFWLKKKNKHYRCQ